MITVVFASECFAGCSKKTIENSAASNASVLEENEKEAEDAKKTENTEEMPEKLKIGNTKEMAENISEDTEKESGTEISETTENTSDAQTEKYVVENQEYVYSTYSDIGQLGGEGNYYNSDYPGKDAYLKRLQTSHTMESQIWFQ